MEIKCRYYINGSLVLLSKKDIQELKAFGKIVFNYFKIKRIEKLCK